MCRTDDDFIHIKITGLLNGIGDRTTNGICITGDSIKFIHARTFELSRFLPTADSISRASAHFTRVDAVDCDHFGTSLSINPGSIDSR